MMTSGCSTSLSGFSGADLCGGGWSIVMLTSIFSGPQGIADGRKQHLRVEGLAEEPVDAERAFLIGDFMTAGDQENRQLRTHFLHQVPKLESVDAGHADV